MSKKVLTVERSQDFIGLEVFLWGLITGDDLRFLSDDMECACNTFFDEQTFSVLINAFGCTLYDEVAQAALKEVLETLQGYSSLKNIALLAHREDTLCELPEPIPLFVDKEQAIGFLCS